MIEVAVTADKEAKDTDEDFDPFITDEDLKQIALEEEEESSVIPDTEITEQEVPFDTDSLIQSPKDSPPRIHSPLKDTPPEDQPTTPPVLSPTSQESSSHSSPPPTQTISTNKSIKKPVNPMIAEAVNRIKKAVKHARVKKQNELQNQIETLTTMVKSLSQQVDEFDKTKQRVNEYMSRDMDEIIQEYTNEYLTNNLTDITSKEVKNLIKPIKHQLNERI